MISPERSWEVSVRYWDVLGVHVTSCEYMKSPERFLEVFGGPWRSWGVLGSLEVPGGPGRFLESHGRTWEEDLGSLGRSWEVI